MECISSLSLTLFWEASTHNETHTTPFTLSVDATHDADTLALGHIVTDTHQSVPGEALPGLPNHLVVAHIFRPECFDDPADV